MKSNQDTKFMRQKGAQARDISIQRAIEGEPSKRDLTNTLAEAVRNTARLPVDETPQSTEVRKGEKP